MSRHSKRRLLPPSVLFFSMVFLIFCSALCIPFLFGTGLPETDADIAANEIPYDSPAPEPFCFLLSAVNSDWQIYLDFEAGCTHIIPRGSVLFSQPEKYLRLDDASFAGAIDRFGGLELVLPFPCDGFDNLERRYTGTQLIRILNSAQADAEQLSDFKNKLICLLFEKISETGFSKSDFSYIINHGESNLSYIDYYDASEFLPQVFSACDFYQ